MTSIDRTLVLRGAPLAAALTLTCSAAFGQAAPAVAPVAVPAMDCPSPGDFPKESRPGMNTQDRFQKKFDDYKKCVFAYADQMKAKTQESVAAAKAYQDAYNGAVTSYNDYANKLNEQQAAMQK